MKPCQKGSVGIAKALIPGMSGRRVIFGHVTYPQHEKTWNDPQHDSKVNSLRVCVCVSKTSTFDI